MSTIKDGYIIEADEGGVGIIPAPPKVHAMDAQSMGSSLPSRDSVSAAIALVRAKQRAKTAIQRVEQREDQILQPRSFSSSASAVSDSSMKSKVTSEGENAAPSSVREGKPLESTVDSTPDLPSNTSSTDSEDLPDVDAKTLNDVNAFLDRLGVGALAADSVESLARVHSEDSIEKLRMLISPGASADNKEDDEQSSDAEIEPEKLEEISAFIDAVVKKESMQDEASQDPPSDLKLAVPDYTGAIPGASFSEEEVVATSSEGEVNPFLDQDEEEAVPLPPSKESDQECDRNEQAYVASVRHVLSTVEEAASMEVEEGEEEELGEEVEVTLTSSNEEESPEIPIVVSEDQESVYGMDGKKEPKGKYKKDEVEVEKIPMPNVGVEQSITSDMSVMSTDSLRKTVVAHDMDDASSVPWALRDVASEETMRATGRTRNRFVVSGPRPSSKSRNVASLFDDASTKASEAPSVGSFGSEMRFGILNQEEEKKETTKEDEDEGNSDEIVEKDDNSEDEEEVKAADSLEETDNKCFVDNLLYTDYDEEDDYAIQRGVSSGIFSNEEETDGVELVEEINPSESCDVIVEETGEVEITTSQHEELVATATSNEDGYDDADQNIKQDPSGELGGNEVGRGIMSPTKVTNIVGAIDDGTDMMRASKNEEKGMSDTDDKKVKQSSSFLEQFEALGLDEDEEEEEAKTTEDKPELNPAPSRDKRMQPATLINYFRTIENRTLDEEVDEKLINEFKCLIAPVIDGKKPTIIEEAQLRQAALKASVPLEYVDTFVEYVKDEHPFISPQTSVESETDFLLKGWEEIEDVNEDEAIAAFLSAKFGEQMEEERKKAAQALKDSIREKKTKALMGRGSRDYEPENDSVTSTIRNEYTGTETETNCDTMVCESTDNDGLSGSSESEESVEEFSFSVPKIVGTIRKDENVLKQESNPIDEEMLQACRSIEGYEEGIWQRRTAMATYGWEWKEALWLSKAQSPRASNLSGIGVDGLSNVKDGSNELFKKRSFPVGMKNSKLSYNRRIQPHGGFLDVDMISLQESAASGEENVEKDETPWELRYVRQRFLHERSLSFSRNWFGELVKARGNDKIKPPICKPKSMEMPMRKIPDPGDWTPEWYTSWGGKKFLNREESRSFDEGSDSGSESGTEREYSGKDSLRSYYSSGSSSFTDDDEDWEDAPECGNIVNTKQKIGEHVSRVHPDYTSSLRKSRWRKKYFPIGTFPY